ncbi:MAG TPA: glycoside hydrolase family 20 zincin-like fold domain-containing protein [Terracidiphilus sp.]|nr:glycoside hydrolase family 20 zincin-like fold domain-containing protein [Terracidiphilus sp.]
MSQSRFSPIRPLHFAFTVSALSLLVPFAARAQDQPPAQPAAQVHLLPAPREASFKGQTGTLGHITVAVPGRDEQDLFAARDLEDAIKQVEKTGARANHGEEAGPRGGAPYRVTLLRRDSTAAKTLLARNKLAFDPAMESEGYVIVLDAHEAIIVGASSSGIFYGVQTFKQLLPLAGDPHVLPTGTIRDWPAMRYRGIDDDLSRGPFPTLDFQKHQIRVFASFKANIYSPYFEHTLLYPGHPLPAPPGSSLSPAEAKELVDYARQYHVTIVPEQEAFGHLHHVLKFDLYQDEAETPHGHVLAPGQASTLPLIKDWFTQIAQEFPSPFIHIGADETWDLGRGRTQQRVQQQGYGPVYMDFLKQIHDELAPLNRRLLFWGDIGDQNPDSVSALPKDMIAVPWGYGAHENFDKMIEPFAKAGIETWVAPGDSNWNEVYPRAQNAFWNIQGFIREGQKLGSTGALTTVWNDDGEGLFNMDWYTVLFGAVAAWQPGESSIANYQQDYGQDFNLDPSGKINAAEKELMAANEALNGARTDLNSDEVFWIDPWSAQGQSVSAKVLPVAVEIRTHAENAIVLLEQVRYANPQISEPNSLQAMDLGARRLDLIGMKFELAQEMESSYAKAVAGQHDKSQRSSVENALEEISSNNGLCQDLRDAYSAIKSEYSEVWLGENRPYWLNNVTVRYDLAIQMWQQRGDRFQQAIRDSWSGKDLPAPATLDLPADAH